MRISKIIPGRLAFANFRGFGKWPVRWHISMRDVFLWRISNFVVDSDFSLKLCDFPESALLPFDADVDTVDDNGYSTRIDVGQLCAVIYGVVNGVKCDVDPFKNNLPTDGRAYWPKRGMSSQNGGCLAWFEY